MAVQYDPRRHDVTMAARLAQRDVATWRRTQEERAWRRWRNRWLVVIAIGVLLLIGLAFVPPRPAGAACQSYSSAARVTNVARLRWPLRGFSVAGYTYGQKWFWAARSRQAYQVGQTVIVTGCMGTERQLTGVTVALP